MERKDFAKRFLAGSFFIIGIALIVIVVFVIGIDQGLTQPKFQVSVLFKEVGGLSVGAPVRLSGVNIGSIRKIDFLEECISGRNLTVTINIFEKFRGYISKGTAVSIKTEGVLGEKFIEIDVNENAARIEWDKVVFGTETMDVEDLTNMFEETTGSITKTTEKINGMMTELEYISRKTKRLFDRIEQRVIDGTLFKVF